MFFFQQRDVDMTKSVPLAEEPRHDRLVWHSTKAGVFSVKSAYKVGMKMLGRDANLNEGITDGCKSTWDLLWQLLIPPVVRHFL